MHRRVLSTLAILFSLSWALEMYRSSTHCVMAMANPRTIHSYSIVHLGELCRWLFLFKTMSSEGFWLNSRHMYAWIVGSVVVALYMPIVVRVGCDGVMRVSFNPRCRYSESIVFIVPSMGVRGRESW